MIQLGVIQSLKVARETPQGYYLEDAEGNDVLMPRALMADPVTVGESREVLVCNDSQGRYIASMQPPLLTVGKFAPLRVTQITEFGAFCNWGTPKELLVPFKNQPRRMVEGRTYVVYMYFDEATKRLVGTIHLIPFLKQTSLASLKLGQQVDLLVFEKAELGYRVVIDQQYAGLIYFNECPEPLHIGQQLKGYIKPLRDDGKIDVSLNPIGVQSIEPNARIILDRLQAEGGFLPFSDKSDPDEIRDVFGISKKLFKKALGTLYRERKVELHDDGIYLLKS